MTIHPDDVLAVVSQSGPSVTFFAAATHERLGVLELPPEPHELLFDPDHRVLYATITYHSGFYGHNSGRACELVVIDADAREIVEVLDLAPEHGPHGLALDRARGLLYVSVEASDTAPGGVLVLDTATRKQTGRIDTMAPGPHWFAISPDGRHGWAANKEAPFVSAVDLGTGQPPGRITGRIPVERSEGVAVSPDGTTVAVAAPPGLLLLDPATGRTRGTLPTTRPVVPVHYTAAGELLAGEMVTVPGSPTAMDGHRPGLLHVHAAGGHELRGSVEVGRAPLTITSAPDGTRAYVSALVDSTVSVVDLATLRVLDTLHVEHLRDQGAHGLAYIAH